jgi:hypothetical protein
LLPCIKGRNPKKYQQHQLIRLDHAFPIHHSGFYPVCPVPKAGFQAPTVAGPLATPDT